MRTLCCASNCAVCESAATSRDQHNIAFCSNALAHARARESITFKLISAVQCNASEIIGASLLTKMSGYFGFAFLSVAL
jgi:hypothetical protein